MFNWVNQRLRAVFLSSFQESDREIDVTIAQLQTLRGRLAELYAEVDLAMHAAALVEEQLGQAKGRIKARIEQQVAPREFSLHDRQRA